MKGHSLVLGGILAGFAFWVFPSILAKTASPLIPFALSVIYGFATGRPADKKYNSLLESGSLSTPLVRISAQLGVLAIQIVVALALSPLVAKI